MAKSNRKYLKKDVFHMQLISFGLFLCVVLLSLFISVTDLQSSKINESTASYISFNNLDTTDILKITNIEKFTDKKGKSFRNKHFKDFSVSAEENMNYQIILYHVGTVIDEKYVKFSLNHHNKEVVSGSLDQMDESENGGRVIFSGTVEGNDDWKLRMWIDNSYKEDNKNISYEIRIR